MGAASLRRGTIASANQATTSTVVKAPQLVRASLVKRRYTKYLALPFLRFTGYKWTQLVSGLHVTGVPRLHLIHVVRIQVVSTCIRV